MRMSVCYQGSQEAYRVSFIPKDCDQHCERKLVINILLFIDGLHRYISVKNNAQIEIILHLTN